jgi:hypothetical protein
VPRALIRMHSSELGSGGSLRLRSVRRLSVAEVLFAPVLCSDALARTSAAIPHAKSRKIKSLFDISVCKRSLTTATCFYYIRGWRPSANRLPLYDQMNLVTLFFVFLAYFIRDYVGLFLEVKFRCLCA